MTAILFNKQLAFSFFKTVQVKYFCTFSKPFKSVHYCGWLKKTHHKYHYSCYISQQLRGVGAGQYKQGFWRKLTYNIHSYLYSKNHAKIPLKIWRQSVHQIICTNQLYVRKVKMVPKIWMTAWKSTIIK